jgi:hypothetical protein
MISETIRSRSSALPNSITTRPRFLLTSIWTRVARTWIHARLRRGFGLRWRPVDEQPDEFLHLSHREALGGSPQRQGCLRLLIGQPQQGPGVAGLDLPVHEELLDRRGELQEPDRVRDV